MEQPAADIQNHVKEEKIYRNPASLGQMIKACSFCDPNKQIVPCTES
jgi:hypothetical protein